MFTLRRVTFPGAPSPMSRRITNKLSQSTTALQDLDVDEECACVEEPVERPAAAVRSQSTSAISAFAPDDRRRPPPLVGILKHKQ